MTGAPWGVECPPMFRVLAPLLVLIVLWPPLEAQALGPDLLVADLTGIENYAHDPLSGVDAFSVGTVACNLGTQSVSWVAGSPAHPVIALQAYRLLDGRLEQVGLSWVRHPFFAVAQSFCSPCNGVFGTQLGAGCSDHSTASLNGSQLSLGPRTDVNPATGVFPFPPSIVGTVQGSVDRRLQISLSDLAAPGARWFVEAMYLASDEASAGNQNDNASWREFHVSPVGGGFDMSFGMESVHAGETALTAWAQTTPEVAVVPVDIPGDGRIYAGLRVLPLPGGSFRWDLAIQNFNSHEAVSYVSLPIPTGATVSAPRFHDVEDHSGSPVSGADWALAVNGTDVSWFTSSAFADPNANAIRWGTLYNFGYESDLPPPNAVTVTLRTFRTGISIPVTINLPDHLAKLQGDGQATNLGEVFAAPLQVRLTRPDGTPVSGATVSFEVLEGPVALLSNPGSTTDAAGIAQVQVTALAGMGPARIRASANGSAVDFDLFVRGLQVSWSPTTGLFTLQLATNLPNQAFTLAGDFPRPPVSTPWGTICTSVLAPQLGLVVASAVPNVGIFDPSLVTDSTGSFSLVQIVPPSNVPPGLQAAIQVYAFDFTGGALGIFISNCQTVVF